MSDRRKVLPSLRNKIKALCKKGQKQIEEKNANKDEKVLEVCTNIIHATTEALPQMDRVRVLVEALKRQPKLVAKVESQEEEKNPEETTSDRLEDICEQIVKEYQKINDELSFKRKRNEKSEVKMLQETTAMLRKLS